MSAPAPEVRGEAPAAARLLVFSLDDALFGIPLGRIVEIIPYRPPTPVPGAAGAVLGILPLRGRMVTILDARVRLGMAARPGVRGTGRVIVLEDGGELVGLAVDGVARVAAPPPGERRPLPAALHLARPELYTGALPGPGGCVLALDLERLLQEGGP